MKSFAAIPLFASAALAFTVPTGLSDTCSTYLATLDKDTSLAACTSSIINATSAFAPGSNGAANVDSALDQLCGSSSSCSESVIRNTLSQFQAACPQEMSSGSNQQLMEIYDLLYTIYPLHASICSQDTSGNRCVKQLAGTPPAASDLYTGSQTTLTPNFQTLQSSNVAFLFLQPTLDESKLCQPCTRSIMSSYISFESDINYAAGLGKSLLLSGQTPLYQAVQTKCGANFLSGAVQAAGSLSDGILGGHSGAGRTLSGSGGVIASLFGAVTVAVAAAL